MNYVTSILEQIMKVISSSVEVKRNTKGGGNLCVYVRF